MVVLEKSRGFGGRAASRTVAVAPTVDARLDHGAQYFTARSDPFRAQVERWQSAGVVTQWSGGLWSVAAPDSPPQPPSDQAHPRFIAPAGMNAIGKALAEGLEVHREAEVARIEASSGGWRLAFKQDLAPLSARALLLTAPAPQALALLPSAELDPEALAAAQRIRFAPCFALMAGFDATPGPLWPAVKPSSDAVLGFLAHDASKRPAPHPTTLVLQATPAWTRANFDLDPEAVAAAMLEAASAYWPPAAQPTWTRLHRWRYAMPEVMHPAPWLELAPGMLLAGDAFEDGSGAGGRIEGAYLSGAAAAARLLARS